MQFLSLKHLKSGTDIRGVAVGEKITLTDEAIQKISRAFIKWLSLKYKKTHFVVAVGNDSRISASRVFENVKEGILSSGSDIVYTGLSSTPSMFILLKESNFSCSASIMITASHLPYDRNGLKFFTPDGGLDGKDIDEILLIAEKGDFLVGCGKYSERSYMDEYAKGLVERVRLSCGSSTPLLGKKIIVDAGNGAGGFFAEKVLEPLGADTYGSRFLEPDGYFPNHIPNPEDKDAIESLSKSVIETNADLGIIFDTDVDRAGAVANGGMEINRNRLIALVSAILLKEKKGVIVTDSVTSDGLTEFIKELGGEHLRFKRGYKNVIDKCLELNNNGIYSPLAIETSGHAAFKENYFLDDGAYLTTKLLIAMSNLKENENIFDLIKDLKEPKECDEVRVTFLESCTNFRDEGNKIIEDLKEFALNTSNLSLAESNYEGARINFCDEHIDGWLLVRMSVHDPVMPINFESNVKGGNKLMAQTLLQFLKNYNYLKNDNLIKFLQY